MDSASFGDGVLTGLRESLQAPILIGLVLAYLARTGNARHFPMIGRGAALAIAACVVAGLILYFPLGDVHGPQEEWFEGTLMLVTAALLTWLLFRMRSQAAALRGRGGARLDLSRTDPLLWGLALLAGVALVREGFEVALFLVGQLVDAAGGDTLAASGLVGGLIGVALAVAIGYAVARASLALGTDAFFRWTGIALILVAAGLVSHAVHKFIETGVAPIAGEIAFDLRGVLPHDAGVGQFLRALFGYSAQPEVAAVIVHATYAVIGLWLYLRHIRSGPMRGARPRPAAAG